MDDPATSSTASERGDDAALRRSTAAVIKASLLALVLVAAAAIIVAVVVLRTPAAAVDPTGRQGSVGVARAAPNDLPAEPTWAPKPPAVDVGGDPLVVTALTRTVLTHDTYAPAQAPTPTPRVMSLPTVAVPTPLPRMAAAETRSGEPWLAAA